LIATAIANAIGQRHEIFQLPAVAFGCSHEHVAFPGTVSLNANTMGAIVADISTSLGQQGINALIVVNGHGGNYVLANVAQQANAHGAIRVGLYPSREDWTEARHAAGITSSNHDDMRAGELETSILLATHPAYVRDGWHTSDHAAPDRRYLTTLGMNASTTSGVIGYPSRATAEKGPVGPKPLTGLSDRVEALGGKMTIQSHAGSGTSLLVNIPIETDEQTPRGQR
jgi:creatinine amidohydrolase